MFSRKPGIRFLAVMLVIVMTATSFPFIGTAAADTVTVTVKGTDGTTIDTVETVVGETVNLVLTSNLPYKSEDGKFLTFVDNAGKVHGVEYEVSESTTLTAVYQTVHHFYSADDIAYISENSSARIENFSLTSGKTTYKDGSVYYRITSGSSIGAFGLFFTDEDVYEVSKTEVTRLEGITDYVGTNRISLQLYTSFATNQTTRKTIAHITSGFYENLGNNTYSISAIFPHTDYPDTTNTHSYGYRLGPWGFSTSTDKSGRYLDIKYIGSFANADTANAFDFDRYMGYVVDEDDSSDEDDTSSEDDTTVGGSGATVTVKDTNGNTIETLEKETGEILDLLAISDLDYIGSNNTFLSFIDENEKVYGTEYEVVGDATLTAKYQSLHGFYTGTDIAALSADEIKLTGFSGSTVYRDGHTHFRATQTADNTNVISIYFPRGYTFKPNTNYVTKIDASTDFKNTARTFLQYFYEFKNEEAKTNTTSEYKTENGDIVTKLSSDGRYHFVNLFTLTNFLGQKKTDVYGYRFAPFGGYGTTSATYTVDIKYIATFESEEIANAFDFDAYYDAYIKTQSFDVSFKDIGGKTVTFENVPYGNKIAFNDIKEALPYGFVTQYFEGDKLYVLSGWSTTDGEEYPLNVTSNGILEYNAVYKEAIIYTPEKFENNNENISSGNSSGSNHGIEYISDQYRHDYLRVYDSSANHGGLKLEWSFSNGFTVNTNTFETIAVKSTTNAAKKTDSSNNPRQSLKPSQNSSGFVDNLSAVPVNYAYLYNNDSENPLWSGTTVFNMPNGLTLKSIRFLPFGAQSFASTDTGYNTLVYSDIEFIGFFANADAANLFDFIAYKDIIDKETKSLAGDTNGDSKVSSLDAVLISRYLASWKDYDKRIYTFNADVNGDTFITPMDVTLLLRRLANWTVEVTPDSERYYNPAPQPTGASSSTGFANYATMTSDDLINDIYEPLRASHPNNITRENIGKDDSGKYDMWCYTFTPDNFDPDSDEYYTVFISAGAHGMNEAQSYLGLARLMQLVWDDEQFDEELRVLREKVRFVTIPLVNVWDVSERANGKTSSEVHSPYNSNNVNINRNWLTDTPEQEVANIRALIYRRMDEGYEFDFGYDFHTDPEGVPGYGTYLLVYPYGVYSFFSDRLKEVCAYLDYKNFDSKGINIKDAFRGDNLNYPASSSYDVNLEPDYPRTQNISTASAVMWTEFGFPGATIEHGSRKFGDRVYCGSDDMTAAVELYANQILQQLNYDFKEKIAVSKGQGN